MKTLQVADPAACESPSSEGRAITTFEHATHKVAEETFSDLVERHFQMAFNVALRMLRNPADAEDAAQEAFISAFRAFPTFKGQSKASTWLYRIVVNVCLMKIRKEKVRAKFLTQNGYEDEVVHDWQSTVSWNDPERAVLNGELRTVLEKGLDRLTPEVRSVVVLRDVQGFTTEEAAVVLDITVPSLKARLHRGRVLLRKYLEGYVAGLGLTPSKQN